MKYFAVYLSKILPGVMDISIHENLLYIHLRSKFLVEAVDILKNHGSLRFRSLMDIWGVDYPNNSSRFEVNYMLLSLYLNIRVVLRLSVEEFSGVQSISSLFNSAGWLEREVWDMFGVFFFENKDLRRILTDYGFNGHPLRKDFPLSGFMEVRYDDSEKRVVYEPLEVAQEYRSFNFNSPWEKL
jgi:NADH-quinone oxidoreductase subunit C